MDFENYGTLSHYFYIFTWFYGYLFQICFDVMAQRNHKSGHVQSAVLQLIPRLASITSESGKAGHFTQQYLPDAVTYILASVKRDRQQAFFTIGFLTMAVGDAIRPQLPKIMDFLRTTLRPKEGAKKKSNAPSDDPAYICLCMLARSVGIRMADELEDILDAILSGQLRPPLVAALKEICTALPAMRNKIQEGLLKILSLILLHRQLQHPGAPKSASDNAPPIIEDVFTTVLALRTLGNFDFEGETLMMIHWFIGWLINWLIDWSFDWLIDWLID